MGFHGRSLSLIFFAGAVWVITSGATGAGPEASLLGLCVYVADSQSDQVLKFVDRDGSGTIDPASPGEAGPFYADLSPGPDLSIPSALLLDARGGLYLLDGGTLDAVYVLSDRDGDGTANGEGEWKVFFDDSSPGPNLSTPGAMAFGADGALYIADDGKGVQRILRLLDSDGDGDALDDGEWLVVYDKTALSPPEGALLDIEALAAAGVGKILGADSTLGRLYLFSDLNSDGDFLDAEEAKVFFDPQGAFAFGSLKGLCSGSGGEVFAADSDTGLVVRLQDLDGDGSAMGSGEWTVFLDPALATGLGDAEDLALTPDGTLVILDKDRDAVILARDLDGDGTAMGAGETLSWLSDSGSLLTTPSALAIGPAPPEPRVVILGLIPSSGSIAGGTQVHIEGKFESPETAAVAFGDAIAVILAASPVAIDCITPPAAGEGPVDVRVTTAAGEASVPGGFIYLNRLFIRGDGNGDGAIDISDAVAILSYLFLGGEGPDCEDPMDVDDDGELNITDPIFLLSYLFQNGPPIPPPGPEPGFDGTPDSLSCRGGSP